MRVAVSGATQLNHPLTLSHTNILVLADKQLTKKPQGDPLATNPTSLQQTGKWYLTTTHTPPLWQPRPYRASFPRDGLVAILLFGKDGEALNSCSL